MKEKLTKKKPQRLEDITGRRNTFILLIVIIFILDRLSKYLAFKELTQEINIIPWVFSLKFAVNTGAGFGFFQGRTLLLSIISIIFIIIICINLKAIMQERYYWAAALIVGGAISNLFDRIFYGFVIDFMYITHWPIFNMADTAITIGVISLMSYIVLDWIRKD